jgi:hypothetical protein
MPDGRRDANELMRAFAERTGLTSGGPQVRYLWTDAFAVCNLLALAQSAGEGKYFELALRLVDRVHHTLGRHRSDDSRTGWISGLSEADGEAHPTRGGLRIGKKLPERRPGEPSDERLEWDRDGQYFHYLTKWMHALDQVSRFKKEPRFNLWARELAERVYAAFSFAPRGTERRRLAWKMSIDLSRPLVSSMGQHDPLDGYITCAQLRSTASKLTHERVGPSLQKELAGLIAMSEGGEWETADPLGLGGLLTDAWRVEQLIREGAFPDPGLLPTLLETALAGLRHYAARDELREPAARRLAFRELGLSIGLQALRLMRGAVQADSKPTPHLSRVTPLLQALDTHTSMGLAIQSFWLDPRHQEARTWAEHRDINEVMLATSLVPEGFLVLSPPS